MKRLTSYKSKSKKPGPKESRNVSFKIGEPAVIRAAPEDVAAASEATIHEEATDASVGLSRLVLSVLVLAFLQACLATVAINALAPAAGSGSLVNAVPEEKKPFPKFAIAATAIASPSRVPSTRV